MDEKRIHDMEDRVGMAFTPSGDTPEGRKWAEGTLKTRRAATFEFTPVTKVDYFTDKKATKPLSWSMLTNAGDAFLWLKDKHPKWHPDVLRIVARSEFPNKPVAKPPVRRKRATRNPAHAAAAFKILHQKTIIKFN